ncbi:unnamed protein product, partial [Polarella glacialis]
MPVVGSGSRSRIAGTDGASACWLCLGVASVLVRWIPGHGFSSLTRTRSDTKAWLRTTSGSSVLPSRSLAVAPISAPEGSSTPVLGAVLAASAAGALAAVHRQSRSQGTKRRPARASVVLKAEEGEVSQTALVPKGLPTTDVPANLDWNQ